MRRKIVRAEELTQMDWLRVLGLKSYLKAIIRALGGSSEMGA